MNLRFACLETSFVSLREALGKSEYGRNMCLHCAEYTRVVRSKVWKGIEDQGVKAPGVTYPYLYLLICRRLSSCNDARHDVLGNERKLGGVLVCGEAGASEVKQPLRSRLANGGTMEEPATLPTPASSALGNKPCMLPISPRRLDDPRTNTGPESGGSRAGRYFFPAALS